MAKGEGTLSADVTSAGTTREDVPLITFVAKDFAPKGGLAVLTEAPATLTEDGSKAFGSMYRAGTEMDPVSLAVAVDDKARLPALPDLGSEPTAAAEPSAKASAKPSAAPVAAASDSGPGAGTYAAVGGGVLLLAAAGTFFALRRRGAGQGPDADATSAGSDAPQTS